MKIAKIPCGDRAVILAVETNDGEVIQGFIFQNSYNASEALEMLEVAFAEQGMGMPGVYERELETKK